LRENNINEDDADYCLSVEELTPKRPSSSSSSSSLLRREEEERVVIIGVDSEETSEEKVVDRSIVNKIAEELQRKLEYK